MSAEGFELNRGPRAKACLRPFQAAPHVGFDIAATWGRIDSNRHLREEGVWSGGTTIFARHGGLRGGACTSHGFAGA